MPPIAALRRASASTRPSFVLRPTTAAAAFAALLLSAHAPGARAQAAPGAEAPASAPTATLPEVRATGSAPETATTPVIGYRAQRAITATKTDTPLKEVPQSISVITRDEIVDLGSQNLQDALNYAAGVRSDAYGIDSRSDGFRVRGGYPDEYLDGLRKLFNYYTSNTRTDPYTLERIEVLRGPSAMLYGQGTVGGLINMVSKRPQAERQGEIGIQYGRFNRKQVQADLTGPLTEDGRWLYRLVAVGRDADTQVDHVRDDRALIAPSLTWQPSADTSLTLQALWQKDKSGSTSQFFPWSGVITDNPNGKIPTNRFIGDPDWDRYDSERESLGWLFSHRFDNGWTLRQNTRYTRNEVDYRTLYGDSFSLPGGWVADPVNQRLLGRYADATLTKVRMLAADQHVEGTIETGALRHQVVAGIDAVRYTQSGQSGLSCPVYFPAGACTATDVPLIDVYDPVYPDFTPPTMADVATSRQRQVGFYLQDQIKIGPSWIVTAGLRHDRARNETEGSEVEKASATSKRFGLMYQAANGVAPYVSYSESFTPQANRDGTTFDPLSGEQWEAGVKYEPTGRDLMLNMAVYDLKEKNQILGSGVVADPYRQSGETKAKGVEVELRAKPMASLDVLASYTYTDLDEQLEAMPRHQASFWGRQQFSMFGLDGLSAGAGVRFKNSFTDGNAPQVPSVTLLDAMLAWDMPRWRLALNVNNLTDKEYVATCLSRGDCWYGARRNVVATATYRW